MPSAQSVLAKATSLGERGRFDEALAVLLSIVDDPEHGYRALVEAARLQATLRRHDEALGTLERAIRLRPNDPLAWFRRSLLRLLKRDFEGGWRDYETRLVTEEFLKVGIDPPQLAGVVTRNARHEDLAGRRVLLVPEQGLGDQVMFASVFPDVARLASQVVVACDDRLAGLFASSFPANVRINGQAALSRSDFEVAIAMGSAPRLFRNSPGDFPGTPYLRPRPEVQAKWAERLGPRPPGLRIGLSWRGGSVGTGSRRRSLEIAQLKPVLNLPGCEFVSLQYGDVAAEIAAANRKLGADIRSFPKAEIEDYEELAGLVLNLDAVVSVQTAVVHLCGALGQACLGLLPANPEWRYGLTGESMPWYRSVRLFRQAEPDQWEPVIAAAVAALRSRL
ncbi:tetratricopeptide repeat protein [Phenylobacterium sp.]|uniref:tetratricopeptide repeat protein n=1 Tax=Phenylobacterium sp. TaxID=1871053 RepID=UPI00391D0AE7